MKTNKILSLILSVLFLMALSQNSKADNNDDEFTKKYHKEYALSQQSYLKIKNKFGKIHIENHDANQLIIDVVVTVEAKNQDKANDLFKKIQLTFKQTDTLIEAITNIVSSFKNKDFSIDYTVKMPKHLRIDLYNSFGDVYIQELNGKSNLKVKYGSLTANSLLFGSSKPRTYVVIEYGSANIEKCDWLKLKSSFSKVEIEESEALIIKSKFSKIEVEKSISVVADSKYDDPFEVEEADNVVLTGEYSDINLGDISNIINLNLKYTDLDIENMKINFDKIDLKLKYGNADIRIDDNASYKLDGFAKYGSIDYPSNGKITKNSERTESKYFGTIGIEKNPKSLIKIESKYANVDLN